MNRPYEALPTAQRHVVDEGFKALVRELRLQGAVSVPYDDRAEKLVDAIAAYALGCDFK